jgi:hypothetical protein
VNLTNLAALSGSRGVEIPETHRTQSVRAVRLERVFKKKLRRAIGIDRRTRRLLRDRNLCRNAVHGATGRKHETANPSVQSGVQKTQCRGHIVAEILARILHRFPNVGVGGEVQHRVHARQHRPQPGFVGNVALDEFEAQGQAAAPSGEIVIDHDLVAGKPQCARDRTSDIACPARN